MSDETLRVDAVVYPPPGTVFAPDAVIAGPFDSARINPDGSATLRGLRVENDTFGDLLAGRCGRPDVHDYHAVVTSDASFECAGEGGTYADWPTLRREIEQQVGPDRIADARAKLAQYLRDGGCACHIAPPCSWCTSMCCGEHWEICLGRPPHAKPGTCCEDCPEDAPEAQR